MNPEDCVVADDGVVVVPKGIADELVRCTKRIQNKDRPIRCNAYEDLGLPQILRLI